MHEVFFQKLNEKILVTVEEKEFIKKFLTHKKIRKKQYLLQEGDVCKYIAIVERGALKAYLLDEKGNENITAFALEGWTISDLSSFFSQEPASLNIDAIEDCDLTLIGKADHDELMEKLPKYQTYMRVLITDAYIALQQRLNYVLHLNVDERYKAFTEKYPYLYQRVPQHMIASFMGLSPETLSRVRSRLSKG